MRPAPILTRCQMPARSSFRRYTHIAGTPSRCSPVDPRAWFKVGVMHLTEPAPEGRMATSVSPNRYRLGRSPPRLIERPANRSPHHRQRRMCRRRPAVRADACAPLPRRHRGGMSGRRAQSPRSFCASSQRPNASRFGRYDSGSLLSGNASLLLPTGAAAQHTTSLVVSHDRGQPCPARQSNASLP